MQTLSSLPLNNLSYCPCCLHYFTRKLHFMSVYLYMSRFVKFAQYITTFLSITSINYLCFYTRQLSEYSITEWKKFSVYFQMPLNLKIENLCPRDEEWTLFTSTPMNIFRCGMLFFLFAPFVLGSQCVPKLLNKSLTIGNFCMK